jgi:hypothetical protein
VPITGRRCQHGANFLNVEVHFLLIAAHVHADHFTPVEDHPALGACTQIAAISRVKLAKKPVFMACTLVHKANNKHSKTQRLDSRLLGRVQFPFTVVTNFVTPCRADSGLWALSSTL